MKEESKQQMLTFFEEPVNSGRWDHQGAYTSYFYIEGEDTLQIILLDNRWYRDELCKKRMRLRKKMGKYTPCKDTTRTMLGEEQWLWLEEQFKQPADLRIIGTSTQFLADFNGYEAWANIPWERDRILRLIRDTNADGVYFISGDTHYAELSKLEKITPYPIYDLTSSGLTNTWHSLGPNKLRIGEGFREVNYGLITIDWSGEDPSLLFEVKDLQGISRITHELSLSELR